MTVEATRNRFDEAKIDEIFSALDQSQKPGAAVAIAIGGTPIYRKGFGLANIELPVLLSPAMRMRIGSTTKHFTCLAYMLLCEEGKAGIDDPIEKYIPEIHSASRGVTMRQLMGHTSGLRDILAITMIAHGHGRPVTDREMVAYYEKIDDVDFAPGTAWSYNNGGYILLTAAIERLTGQTLDEVLRDRIFEPLGMKDTMLRRWDQGFVPNSATLHMVDQHGNYSRDYMGMEISGAGGMVSTMDDMLIWLKHMDSPTVGSAETWRLMREPHRLGNGSSTGYGLGLMTAPYRGVTTISHGGGVMGGNSQMIKVPSAGLDISIAVNRADASAADLANKIIDLLVDGLEEEPAKAEAAKLEGTYVSPTSGRVVSLSTMEEMQLMSIDGAPGLPVELLDGRMELPAAMRFMQTSFVPGEALGVLNEFGNEDPMERVTLEPDATLGARAGTYVSDLIDVTAEVLDDGNERLLNLSGRHGGASYKMEPITRDIWRAGSLGPFSMIAAIISFDEKGLDLTAGRLKKLRFRRR